jgi:16S rRNA (guanine1207-N2)-methyltransferase
MESLMDDTWKILFHPFDTGAIAMPGEGARALFLGARQGVRLPRGFTASLHVVQGFRPHFLALREDGFQVAPRAQGENHDLALVLCERHRDRNEAQLAEALLRTRPGGLVVIAGSKAEGVASLRKRVGALVPPEDSLSKHHGIVFWLLRPRSVAPDILSPGMESALVEGRFETAAGSFSRDRVDPGSAFLIRNLPGGIGGDVADFAAGWGYLSAELLSRGLPLARLDLYEADHDSLEAARRNLLAHETPPRDFFWRDLVREPVERRYDAIVMNPPFHAGRAAEPRLGQEMIRRAANALKPGGRLILVANRPLPYEAVLAETFSAHGELARDDRFKVLWGRR